MADTITTGLHNQYDPGRLLHEAELLLAHVTSGNGERMRMEGAAITDSVDAVAAMRRALATGEPLDVAVEQRF